MLILYFGRANKVPVGDDQLQHLELTREIAGKIDNRPHHDGFVTEN